MVLLFVSRNITIGVTTRIAFNIFNRIRMINNEGTVIGFITTIDIVYNIKDEKDINNNTIRYTMIFNPTVIKQNKDIEDQTVGVKDKNGISMIPVLEDYERIIGICSRSDILKRNLKRYICSHRYKKTYNNNNNNR